MLSDWRLASRRPFSHTLVPLCATRNQEKLVLDVLDWVAVVVAVVCYGCYASWLIFWKIVPQSGSIFKSSSAQWENERGKWERAEHFPSAFPAFGFAWSIVASLCALCVWLMPPIFGCWFYECILTFDELHCQLNGIPHFLPLFPPPNPLCFSICFPLPCAIIMRFQ